MPTSKLATLNEAPVAETQMLIRRPAAEVFRAFVDPAITTKFWFTKSSGQLEAGKQVRWEWEMYGVSDLVSVKEIETDRRILAEWGSDGETPTRVEWRFSPRGNDATLVTIVNSGFTGSGDQMVSKAIDSASGFSIVLCSLKALLEHGIALNVIADKAPDAHVKH
jgi:uncharacterized protein YndB with AHSA1/START domain